MRIRRIIAIMFIMMWGRARSVRRRIRRELRRLRSRLIFGRMSISGRTLLLVVAAKVVGVNLVLPPFSSDAVKNTGVVTDHYDITRNPRRLFLRLEERRRSSQQSSRRPNMHRSPRNRILLQRRLALRNTRPICERNSRQSLRSFS